MVTSLRYSHALVSLALLWKIALWSEKSCKILLSCSLTCKICLYTFPVLKVRYQMCPCSLLPFGYECAYEGFRPDYKLSFLSQFENTVDIYFAFLTFLWSGSYPCFTSFVSHSFSNSKSQDLDSPRGQTLGIAPQPSSRSNLRNTRHHPHNPIFYNLKAIKTTTNNKKNTVRNPELPRPAVYSLN